jgi:glycosyltransferase involved in cell wall biosynthesis
VNAAAEAAAPTLSVVVCTYNRADLLPGCLDSLAAQTADKGRFEVIVVNNNSSDATQEIAEAFAAREPNARVVGETAQGLSHARNRGWREARGAYVAYIDDDARAEPDWVERALAIIGERAPGVLGGSIHPFYLVEKPRWFKDAYETRCTSERPTELRDEGFISGSNIFFRRSLLEAIGGFDPRRGMQGRRLSYGEETAVILAIRKDHRDEVIFYDPDLRVRHLTPSWKMRVRSMLRARYVAGREQADLFVEDPPGRWRVGARLGLLSLGLAAAALAGVWVRDRGRYPRWQNYAVEVVAPRVAEWGRWGALLRKRSAIGVAGNGSPAP